jgi:hypothetical protein
VSCKSRQISRKIGVRRKSPAPAKTLRACMRLRSWMHAPAVLDAGACGPGCGRPTDTTCVRGHARVHGTQPLPVRARRSPGRKAVRWTSTASTGHSCVHGLYPFAMAEFARGGAHASATGAGDRLSQTGLLEPKALNTEPAMARAGTTSTARAQRENESTVGDAGSGE